MLALILALGSPPVDPPITTEPDVAGGLACYWACVAACVVVGNRLDHCDAACTEMCFSESVPPGPTCDPDVGPACE